VHHLPINDGHVSVNHFWRRTDRKACVREATDNPGGLDASHDGEVDFHPPQPTAHVASVLSPHPELVPSLSPRTWEGQPCAHSIERSISDGQQRPPSTRPSFALLEIKEQR